MNQFQKDMQWCLSSPPLMALPDELDGSAWMGRLIPQQALSVLSCCDRKLPTRLGYYYEAIVKQILKNSAQVTDLKSNIQVIDGKRTVGEFDFVGLLSDNTAFHLECAVKFYLRIGDGSQLEHFIGPAKKDRLDLKWHKLMDKQISLSETVAGQHELSELGIETVGRRLVLLQGYLFHPFDQWRSESSVVFHPAINPQHQRGWWLKKSEAWKVLDPSLSYRMLSKPFWLGVVTDNQNEARVQLSAEDCLSHIESAQQPLLLARFNHSGAEIDRGFVVPDQW